MCYIILQFHTTLRTEVFCPDLMNPANGVVLLTGRTVLAEAGYLCDSGFAVEGLIVRRCLDNGEWGGDDSTCISKQLSTVHWEFPL